MKKISFITVIVILSAVFTGCVSREQREENQKNLLQAEKNAVLYVEEKYGFTADITNSEVEAIGDLLGPTFSGYGLIDMEYNEREFTVYIDGRTQNTNGKDDYQEEEIKSAVKDKLYEITEVKFDNILMQNYYNGRQYEDIDNFHLFYNTYFYGDNLDELSDECSFYFTASCLDSEDISKLDEETMKNAFGENIGAVYSYNKSSKSSDWYSEYKELKSINNSFSQYEYIYGMYISEAVKYENNSEYTYFKPIVQSYGDVSYITESNNIITLNEIIPDALPESWKGKYVIDSKAYSLPQSDEKVWVYFNKNNLPENSKNLRITSSWISENNSRKYSSTLNFEIGDYITRQVTPKNYGYYFMVVQDED